MKSKKLTTEDIVKVLDHLVQLLELRGENTFKIRAYQRAARALENLSEPLDHLVEEGRLGDVEGIGKAIEEKVTELVKTGRLPYYEELLASFPSTLFELFELQGIGAKKIKILHDVLKVSSIADLEAACKTGKVAELAGFGEKSAANILKAITFYQEHAGLFRIDQVMPLAEQLLTDLRAHPDAGQCQAAGSFRRCKEALGDLDLLLSSKKPEAVLQFFVEHPLVQEVIAHGPTKASVRLEEGLQCDLRVVKPEEFPFALNYFTGSKEHNIRLRSRALEQGWSLNEYRFTVQQGRAEPPPIHDERDLYASLGLSYIPPELREDRGEIAAAAVGSLPKLLEWTELHGTFHCHTTASDGKSTLREMAVAAQNLGLDYLGIADHSKSSYQANGLSEERLLQQQEEIKKLNAEMAPFRLFTGTECDILKDGSLDFSDEILASLDYVVASVHSSFALSETAMTDRIIRAIQNPYVTMLGHLTGRHFFSRDPYALNVPAVIEAAADTGTIIELNASPYRLDMDWRWWSLAKEKGVKCVINPDAHSIQGLQNLKYGCLIARKGWLTKEDVVNTSLLEKVIPLLEAKKKKMKPIEEYSTMSNSPQLFFWGGYDAVVKYDYSCSAIVSSAGLLFIDPLPLASEPLKSLLGEASLPPAAILLTSGNHQRWSLELAEQLSLPLYAPVGSGDEIVASHFYKPGDETMGLRSIALPGFGPGETAFLEERGKILILGDALTNAGEAGLLVLPKKYCEDHRLAMRSLAKLTTMSPAILLTAHGMPMTRDVAAKLREASTLG